MQQAKRRVADAVLEAVANAAVNSLPPLAVEAMGHGLVSLGKGMQRTGAAVERAGERTVAYAEDQRDRNEEVLRTPGGPEYITVAGVRYRRAG